jgi:hypothetical protein
MGGSKDWLVSFCWLSPSLHKAHKRSALSTSDNKVCPTSPNKQKGVQFSKSTEARAELEGCGLPKPKKVAAKRNAMPAQEIRQSNSPLKAKPQHAQVALRSPGGSSPFRGATSRLGRLTEANRLKNNEQKSKEKQEASSPAKTVPKSPVSGKHAATKRCGASVSAGASSEHSLTMKEARTGQKSAEMAVFDFHLSSQSTESLEETTEGSKFKPRASSKPKLPSVAFEKALVQRWWCWWGSASEENE